MHFRAGDVPTLEVVRRTSPLATPLRSPHATMRLPIATAAAALSIMNQQEPRTRAGLEPDSRRKKL